MMKISLVFFVIFAISNITRGMRTITSQAGSNINLNWTIHNKTEDVIYVAHNNKTLIVLWAKENYSSLAPEYIDRLDFSFVKRDRELKLILCLKNISKLDEGLYKCYIQFHDEEMETVKLQVTGHLKEPTVKDISRQQPDSTENRIELFCQLSKDSSGLAFWWINESLVVPDKKYVTFNNTLTIDNIEETDQYDNFLCAEDVNSIRSKAYRIGLGGPNIITFTTNETIIYEFGALNVTCMADCYLSCSFQWIKHSEHNSPEKLVSDSATIQIQSATKDNSGKYSCTAKNRITNKTVIDIISLDVIHGPNYVYFKEVQTQDNPIMAKFKTVRCFADCNPPCQYSLIGPGKEIVNAVESLHNVTKNGAYTCQAMNPATGKSSVIRLLTISHEFALSNDSRNNTTKDDKVPGRPLLSGTISMPLLTNILLGTAVFLTCLICGFLVYKSRKRCCKPNSIITTATEVVPPGVDLAISKEFEMVHIDIDPTTSYWTIGEDNSGGLSTVMDETGASGRPCLGLRSCPIKQSKPPENLGDICLQLDEDTYIHPI